MVSTAASTGVPQPVPVGALNHASNGIQVLREKGLVISEEYPEGLAFMAWGDGTSVG